MVAVVTIEEILTIIICDSIAIVGSTIAIYIGVHQIVLLTIGPDTGFAR